MGNVERVVKKVMTVAAGVALGGLFARAIHVRDWFWVLFIPGTVLLGVMSVALGNWQVWVPRGLEHFRED